MSVVPRFRVFNNKRYKLWNCYPTKAQARDTSSKLKMGQMGGKRSVRVIKYYEKGKGPAKYCVFQRRK